MSSTLRQILTLIERNFLNPKRTSKMNIKLMRFQIFLSKRLTTLSDAVDPSAPGHERSVEETVLPDPRPAVIPLSW